MRSRLVVVVLGILLIAQSGRGATYLCFGDSNTGDGSATGGYSGPLASYLESIGQSATMIIDGVGGSTTEGGLDRIQASLAQHPSEFVLVMLGTNDVFSWRFFDLNPLATENNLTAIVDAIRAAGRTVILATIPPRVGNDDVDPTNALTGEMNRIVRTVAASRGITVAEVYANMAAIASPFNYEDGLHPSAFTIPLVAEAFAAAITGRALLGIDLTGPLPVDILPIPASANSLPRSDVQIAVRDNKNGVDVATAVMTIDGRAITPTVDRSRPDVVRFIYNFPTELLFGQRVNVGLTVSDVAPVRRTTSLDYHFEVVGGNGSRGDIDGSGRVDGFDLAILASAFGTSFGEPRYRFEADIDASGIIDGLDLTFLISRFAARP